MRVLTYQRSVSRLSWRISLAEKKTKIPGCVLASCCHRNRKLSQVSINHHFTDSHNKYPENWRQNETKKSQLNMNAMFCNFICKLNSAISNENYCRIYITMYIANWLYYYLNGPGRRKYWKTMASWNLFLIRRKSKTTSKQHKIIPNHENKITEFTFTQLTISTMKFSFSLVWLTE